MSIWPALDIYNSVKRISSQKWLLPLSVHKQGKPIPKGTLGKAESQLCQTARGQHFTFGKAALEMELRIPSGEVLETFEDATKTRGGERRAKRADLGTLCTKTVIRTTLMSEVAKKQESSGEACEHQRAKETHTAKGKHGCEDPLRNLLSYANFKDIIGSSFGWISVSLRNVYTEYLMYPQAQHLEAGSGGSYETARALPKAGKVTQQSLWDFTSMARHPSDKQAALYCHTDTQRPSDVSLCGKFSFRFAASTVRLAIRVW